MAGIIAGNGNGNAACQGLATNANLINLRVLDANGNGTDAGVILVIDTAIALKSL